MYLPTGSIADLPRNKSKPKHLIQEPFIDNAIADDDELSAADVRSLLTEKWPELNDVLLSTIKCCRKELGWVATAPK